MNIYVWWLRGEQTKQPPVCLRVELKNLAGGDLSFCFPSRNQLESFHREEFTATVTVTLTIQEREKKRNKPALPGP